MVELTPKWQFVLAYALLLLPIVFVAVSGGPYPVPIDLAATFYVWIGLAVGAAVFIVRRRTRNVAGWIALIIWGGGSLLAVIHVLAN
jgi:hypothetical protein